jgi:hypothetical protein
LAKYASSRLFPCILLVLLLLLCHLLHLVLKQPHLGLQCTARLALAPPPQLADRTQRGTGQTRKRNDREKRNNENEENESS